MGDNVSLVELGSGSSAKTTILLDSFLETSDDLHYLPIDISRTMLTETADRLDRRYPELSVTPIVSQYESGLARASTLVAEDDEVPDRMMVMFLGSSIGNMEPSEARAFVRGLRAQIGDERRSAGGIRPPEGRGGAERRLQRRRRRHRALQPQPAEHGSTASSRATSSSTSFEHDAFFNADEGRIEMHLRSRQEQDVAIGACGRSFHFDHGESIHTENSYKYIPEWIEELAGATGFRVQKLFTDDKEWFALALFEPV